ncbi:rSAM/selenodomain-associated transferase 1 [Ancylobacter aquaticus]|uniref:RSAM/selenodomain-associated transferase 1 n=1 Tax=Ancylobacter aquaticus TaxID=100 RepID=A0A4R1HQD2_ANCAQ|nr:TIGR04282 family arsenosugar biosynthesis glycosyltransferase [Ancylobacter aquaticus]TCK23451.1 rSAM/selenodomain-associated transferase 1 [Ancylobacter aquaticus]
MKTIAVAVICKTPAPGKSKTRLSPPLRPEECAQISSCFIADLSATIASLAEDVDVDGYAVYTPAGTEEALKLLLPPGFGLVLQGEGNLGDRLEKGIADLLVAGHAGAILINSDSPTLPKSILRAAVDALKTGDDRVVLSPALDGGYTLVGLSQPHAYLFKDIPWSTGDVYRLTLERAREIGLPVVELDAWYDVDDAETYALLEREMEGLPLAFAAPGLSGESAPRTTDFVRHRAASGAAVKAGTMLSSVAVVIPCLNEEEPIADVVRDVLAAGVGEVIVVDNGSSDRTAERAAAAGARVISQPVRGYGRACAAGLLALKPETKIVCFLDGDGSDVPSFIPEVVEPVRAGTADFVMGSRLRGHREAGSMTPQQIVAGWLSGVLLRMVYGVRFTDMSPMRAMRVDKLLALGMIEQTYGWNLEMQMRAAAAGLRCVEIAVDHRRRRGGESKVSGNLMAGVTAAWKITTTFIRLARLQRRSSAAKAGLTARSLPDGRH